MNKSYNLPNIIDQNIVLDITQITYLQLAFAGLHIGEEIQMHSPMNISLVYGKSREHIIFDLKHNLLSMKKGLFLMSFLISNRGKFLYIDESLYELQEYNNILFEFKKVGHNFVNSKWRAGFFSNFKKIYSDICKFVFLIQQRILFKTDLIENKLKFSLGVLYLRRLPSFVFISGIHKCFWASLEVLGLKIPSLIITDTSNEISNFFFPIYSHFSNIENDYLDISFFFVDLFLSIIISGFIKEMSDFFKVLLYKYRIKKIIKKLKNKIKNKIKLSRRKRYLNKNKKKKNFKKQQINNNNKKSIPKKQYLNIKKKNKIYDKTKFIKI